MILSERISALVEYSNMSIPKFSEFVGFKTPQTVRELIKGNTKTLSDAAKIKITLAFPEINPEWLVDGEGVMVKSTNAANAHKFESPVINYKSGVPYYDEDFELGFNEIGFPSSENPQFLVQMPKFKNATLWCNATGDSMKPEINSGDVIALQLIEDPSFLLYGDLYAIVTKNGLRTIKRLGKSEKQNAYKLIPTNKEYDEQDIPMDMILRVFKVLGNLHSF